MGCEKENRESFLQGNAERRRLPRPDGLRVERRADLRRRGEADRVAVEADAGRVEAVVIPHLHVVRRDA